jgi:hypothetical protein
MNNPRVGDRVEIDKLVVGESYMHLTNQEFYIPVKMKSIDKDPKSGILWIEFKILGDIGGRWIPTIIARRPSEESPFFEDLKEMGRNVRNTKLMGAYTGLSHGPESKIASMLTGIEGKNAYQQEDELKKKAGIQGADPNRTQYSGRKTRRKIRSKRTRSKKYKRSA